MAIIQASYHSRARKGTIPFTAILPVESHDPAYHAGPFKTIYLLHGYSGNHTDWLVRTRIEEWAAARGFAVIMPEGLNRFYVDNADTDENYGDFTGRELVDVTRKMFHLSSRREDTAIAGLSMGGYGAVRNGLHFNDTFGAVIALSSAFITDDIAQMQPGEGNDVAQYAFYRHVFGEPQELLGSDKDPKALAEKALLTNAPRLYIACGTEDFLYRQNTDYHAFLEGIGYPHTFVEAPGAHTWDFWNEYMVKGMDWLEA